MENNQKKISLVELLIVIVVLAMLAVITVPNVRAASPEVKIELSAIASLRAIVIAQAKYQLLYGKSAYAPNLAALARVGLIDNELGCAASNCVKNGYVFTVIPSTSRPGQWHNVIALPHPFGSFLNTGTRSFYTNESGIIYRGINAFTPPEVVDTSSRTVSNGIPFYSIFPNKFDFDGNNKSDVAIYRPSNGIWYFQELLINQTYAQFGSADDVIVPADYNGDGKVEITVYRNGNWYSSGGYFTYFQSVQFGEPSDIPVPANYDGDAKADIAVFRPSEGVWYLRQSTDGFAAIPFGQAGDKPIAGDFDGDGKADLAVFRPSTGTWYIRESKFGLIKAVEFGTADDKLVAADYDGDGKMDIAVYRPSDGTWYLNQSAAGMKAFQFGVSTDVPAPADYNGDGKADIAVYRDGMWFIWQSGVEQLRSVQFGAVGDKPVASAYVR